MKTMFQRAAAAAALMAVAAWPAFAQRAPAAAASSPIESRLEARKVVTGADGKESFAPAEAAKPGDVIEYVATYRNTSRQAVRNLEATLPIPPNTELVGNSASPAGARASIDATSYADMPLKRRVVRDGQATEAAIPLGEYRYLRWYPGELGAGQTVTFKARVRVLDDRPSGDPAKGGK